METDNTLSTTEAGKILGLTRRWVFELIRRRKLDAVRIGRDWRVDRDSVEAYRVERVGKKGESK